jgi:hypothetical protein
MLTTIIPYSRTDSDRRDGDEPVKLVYPVPQTWTQWLLSDDGWADYVVRYGLQAVEVPELENWRLPMYPTPKIGYNGTGEHRWNTGLSTDSKICHPNWDQYYLDGIPKEDRVFKNPTWDL